MNNLVKKLIKERKIMIKKNTYLEYINVKLIMVILIIILIIFIFFECIMGSKLFILWNSIRNFQKLHVANMKDIINLVD